MCLAIKPLSEIKIWLTIIIFYYFSNQLWNVLKCRSIFIISFGYLLYTWPASNEWRTDCLPNSLFGSGSSRFWIFADCGPVLVLSLLLPYIFSAPLEKIPLETQIHFNVENKKNIQFCQCGVWRTDNGQRNSPFGLGISYFILGPHMFMGASWFCYDDDKAF